MASHLIMKVHLPYLTNLNIMRSILILVFFFGAWLHIHAQDPIFTQYYTMPQTLNPGNTAINESSSAGVIHRSQWPNSHLKINTEYAFYNFYSEMMTSGIGINALRQSESFSKYSLTQLNLAYAYRVQLSRDWFFHPAIEIGYGFKSYGFQNMLLGDQLHIDTGTIDPVTGDPVLLNENISYFDFNAGAIINNEDFWFGLSVKHLNRPEIAFTNSGNESLNMFFSVSGAYTFHVIRQPRFVPRGANLLVSANFMQQGEYNRLDLGAGLVFDPIYVGVIAATNPARNHPDAPFVTSLNPYVGMEYEHFKITYSYDAVMNGMGQSGGVHEISLIYLFNLNKKCDGCPAYYKGPKTKTYLY